MSGKLYYRLTVWDANKSSEGKKFRLPSNLLVPSPLNTELHISVLDTSFGQDAEASFFVNVIGFEHEFPYSTKASKNVLGDLYMILGTEEGDSLWDPSSGQDPASRKAQSIWEALIKDGWEEITL